MAHRRKNQVKILNILGLLGIFPPQSQFPLTFSYPGLLLSIVSSQIPLLKLPYRDLHGCHPDASVPAQLTSASIISLWPAEEEHPEEEATTQAVSCDCPQATSSCQIGPSGFYSGFSLPHRPSLQPPRSSLHKGLIGKKQIQIIEAEILICCTGKCSSKSGCWSSVLEPLGVLV